MPKIPRNRDNGKAGRASVQHGAMIAALMAFAVPLAADPLVDIEGRYVAVSIEEATGPGSPSLDDIHLEIQLRDGTPVLRWQSLPREGGEPAHHYRVVFEKTRRPGIYLAGMRCDKFGNLRPLDPGSGDPYVWAHVGDDGLALYAMSIADDGTHDLRLYHYKRTGEKLTLDFERVRNDAPIEHIRATLENVDPRAEPAAPGARPMGERHVEPRCG